MKIKDILQRDPATHPLVNQGQARIADRADERVINELKGELVTFVCEGQFADGFQRVLSAYLANLNQTSQKAAWVSGFFGSGKSHLLKVLGHLWQDTRFPDGSTARSLVPSLPDEIRSLLRELDTAGKRAGGLLAAAGSLPSGTTENVRLTVLAVLLRAVGLPDQYAQAQFCFWLHQHAYFDRVRNSVETGGRKWETELNNLYASGALARAVLACDPNFAASEAEARKTIREQFPHRSTDITTAEFLHAAKSALKLVGRDGRLPCTVLILDEVQQYIGESIERSVLVTEVVEAVSKQLDSSVLVIASGQSALTDVPLLHKLMDRFTVRVPLSDADVETVTRKVLLQKKPTSVSEVRSLLDAHAGEVSRQLQGTRIGEAAEDRSIIVDDYPLLPVRRRFWEHCFRQVDAEGTHSQLRSQLRILHDAMTKLSDQQLGGLIPADELYEAIAPEMVNTGVLLREINERIIKLSQDGGEEGKLARRICGLVFLIGKLPREAGADIGVRATKDHIADLMIEDLRADNGKLRSEVGALLEKLVSGGALMRVGEEYHLQTREGTEWDREFRNRQTKLRSDEVDLQLRRDALLYAEADRIVRSLRITQGASTDPRQLTIHRDQNPPVIAETIPVWIRDEWSCEQREVTEEARTVGTDNPVLYVFIPKKSADEFRRFIIEAEAAKQTLDAKGNPTTDEGSEARRGMESRRDLATTKCVDLVKEIVANAKVFQGGGSELLQLTLEEKLREGAEASLIRLFPRFKEADSAAWEAVIKRAKDGADQPFQPVGHTGPAEQHPVCQEVLSTIGSGRTGAEIRKALQASPFGWPKDAIDAALIALHRMQHITATLNGSPVPLGQLDQNKISKSQFRRERETLSVEDRLKLRKLYGLLIGSCKAGEEGTRAPEFLTALASLAAAAAGPVPLPPPPATAEIEDLKRLVGNEQLVAVRDGASDFEKKIATWKKAKELAEQRKPAWELVERMSKHAARLSAAADHITQVEAIRKERMLLAPTDPVAPVRGGLSRVLREAVNVSQTALEAAYARGVAMLSANETWSRLPKPEQSRILSEVNLLPPSRSDVSTDEGLLASLDNRPLAARDAEIDAVVGRAQKALELAAKFLEPKLRPVTVERATLRNPDDVRQWLGRQEKTLLEAVKQGPVLIN